jgi:Peptidyl-tRNA hydrolase
MNISRLGARLACFIHVSDIAVCSSHDRHVKHFTLLSQVQQDHVLVIYDDLDLPTAKTRLRAKGGHGGHNGMRSIVAMLGDSQDFARIRVGAACCGWSSGQGIQQPGHEWRAAPLIPGHM